MEEIYVSESASDTTRLGEKFVKRLHLDQGVTLARVIALYGELGSGKTTFVQGLAKGLGIKQRIISPTFVVIRSYDNFFHIDLYRMEKVEGLGLEEIIEDPANIVVIEWADKLGDLLPKKRWEIKFEHIDEQKRRITWNSN